MTHNSHPAKCKHILKHCEHCDVVYCEKCNKEWKKETIRTYYDVGTTTLPYNPPVTYTSCSHK
jgi:hypothetical protein